jgi:A/G-specific adenine glycosylase
MLQQTQVQRVIGKYNEWLIAYPTVQAVASATLVDILSLWSGLGYNRRARFLHESAKLIVSQYQGIIPLNLDALQALPGIGYNTAAAIIVYATNQPQIFIETNIRTVFIHHYYAQTNHKVSDVEIKKIVADTIDVKHPREWYWALMDYGTYIKKSTPGLMTKSSSYKKQSTFIGSNRQLRGIIIKSLIVAPKSIEQLHEITAGDMRTKLVIDSLVQDKLVNKVGTNYQIPQST